MKVHLKNGTLTIMTGLLIINYSFVFTGCSDKNYEDKMIVTESWNIDNSYETSNTTIYNEISDEISNIKNVDEIILRYYEKEEKEIDELLKYDNQDIKQKISEKVVILIDFLFYGGEIKGITVNEISDETKEKLISITSKLDDKINNVFPDYKTKISKECQDALTFIKEKGNNSINKLDDYLNEKIENYDDIKNGVQSVITDTKDDFDEVKELANSGLSKVKDYYENWRNNVENNN